MSKKIFFAILGAEITVADTVADFAILICDREGKIFNQCAVLINDEFKSNNLFVGGSSEGGFDYEKSIKKEEDYNLMMDNGNRILVSKAAINRWIDQAIGKYNPLLFAYDLDFYRSKCEKTGIDLSGFSENFCLLDAVVNNICNRKNYEEFFLESHDFNPPARLSYMYSKENLEIVYSFINRKFKKKSHTALEDVRDFLLPILMQILKIQGWRNKIKSV